MSRKKVKVARPNSDPFKLDDTSDFDNERLLEKMTGEYTFEVEREDESVLKMKIIKPTISQSAEADNLRRIAYSQAFREGAMTRKEAEKLLMSRGIWTKADQKKRDQIYTKIEQLKKQLAATKDNDVGVELLQKIRQKRLEAVTLSQAYTEIIANTAQEIADTQRRMYLLSKIVVTAEDGTAIFDDLEAVESGEYDDIIAQCLEHLSFYLMGIPVDYEDDYYENRWAKAHNIGVNEQQQKQVKKDQEAESDTQDEPEEAKQDAQENG